MASSLSTKNKIIAFSCLILAPILLSTNMIFGKAAIDAVGPGTLAFYRWLITALILWVLLFPSIWANRALILANLPRIILLASLGMGVCGAGVYAALIFTSATNSGLIYGVSPILILLFGAYFLAETIRPMQWAGVAVALTGAMVIVTKGDLNVLRELSFNVGDLLMLAAITAWALYSVFVKQGLFRQLSTFTGLALLAMGGALVNAPLFIAEGLNYGFVPMEPKVWWAIAGLVCLSSFGAFGTYTTAIAMLGPGRTGPVMYLLPVHTVLMSVFFLGETFKPYHGVGLALVLSGVILATLRMRRKTAVSNPANL